MTVLVSFQGMDLSLNPEKMCSWAISKQKGSLPSRTHTPGPPFCTAKTSAVGVAQPPPDGRLLAVSASLGLVLILHLGHEML